MDHVARLVKNVMEVGDEHNPRRCPMNIERRLGMKPAPLLAANRAVHRDLAQTAADLLSSGSRS